MKKILEFMAEDHDKLDKMFKQFEDSRDKTIFHNFKISLQKHIVWEEEILFPIFENKNNMHNTGPTAVMRMEHRQIKDFLEKIHSKVIKKINGINELKEGMLEVLKLHNEKEEKILYPWIDNSISEDERKEIFTKIRNLPEEKYNNCCE